MSNEDYIPKRGDIVQFVGGEGEIGIVAGWLGPDTLVCKNIENKETFSGSFREGFNVLIRKDQFDAVISALPRTVELTDEEQ